MNSAMVAHVFPAFGNPLDLPLDLFLLLLDRIGYVRQVISGSSMSDREYVDFAANFDQLEE